MKMWKKLSFKAPLAVSLRRSIENKCSAKIKCHRKISDFWQREHLNCTKSMSRGSTSTSSQAGNRFEDAIKEVSQKNGNISICLFTNNFDFFLDQRN